MLPSRKTTASFNVGIKTLMRRRITHKRKTTTKTKEHLAIWTNVVEDNLEDIKLVFELADKDILQFALNSGIHDFAQRHLQYNLLGHAYGNHNPGIIQLLENLKLDVEAYAGQDPQHGSALHAAACNGVLKNIKLLLNKGVDANTRNEYGESPLMCVLNCNGYLANKIECVNIFLKSNVDVEIRDNEGKSFIEYLNLNKTDDLLLAEPVLAHLAMREAMGLPLQDSTLAYLQGNDELKSRYEACQQQLAEMKARVVARSFSLFTVVSSTPDKIARFVGAQIGNIMATVYKNDSLLQLNEHYEMLFTEHLDRALEIHELRCKLVRIIRDCIPEFIGYDTVIDNIVYHFNFEQLCEFN